VSDDEMSVTIYHNPACGTSRNVLAILEESGWHPIVIEYLKTPPDRDTLTRLIRDIGHGARYLLRQKGTPYEALGLSDPSLTEDAIIEQMLAHPILINRPIVVTSWGTRLCRPSESVRELLAAAPIPGT
jgi:arsenate reductase (glutaredoxin)